MSGKKSAGGKPARPLERGGETVQYDKERGMLFLSARQLDRPGRNFCSQLSRVDRRSRMFLLMFGQALATRQVSLDIVQMNDDAAFRFHETLDPGYRQAVGDLAHEDDLAYLRVSDEQLEAFCA